MIEQLVKRMFVSLSVCAGNNVSTIYMTSDFGTVVYLDTIWVKFEGQGHRSKFKVTNIAKVIGVVRDFYLTDLNGFLPSGCSDYTTRLIGNGF